MDSAASHFVVTGADGWLGRTLLRVLLGPGRAQSSVASGAIPPKMSVLVVDEAAAEELASQWPGLEVTVGDVRDAGTAARLLRGKAGHVLVHTAAVIHPRRVRDFYAINVGGTSKLLRAAAAEQLRRAVVVSSNSPCGFNRRPDALFDEHSPYAPYMNYGRSKMVMEESARRIAADSGLDLVIVRAPWFYGPCQPERQTRFFRMIRDGAFPIVGDGMNRRSMAYTETLAEGLVRAALVEAARGQTYWMADRRPYTMLEIVQTVERLLRTEFGQQCRGRYRRIPGICGDAARAMDAAIQALGFYSPEIHVLSEMNLTIACSVDKACRELGFDPRIELEEGMRRSLAWLFEARGGL